MFICYASIWIWYQIVDKFEKDYFARIIREAEGNISKASRLADLSRTYLSRKLKEHNIEYSE